MQAAMQASEHSAWNSIHLEHDALPELDFDEVTLETPFLSGKSHVNLTTPFFISGMTAGHAAAPLVNERLAVASAKRGWMFGVGSQRRELDESRPLIDSWNEIQTKAPRLFILGNLGLAQAIQTDTAAVRRLAANVGAKAFCIHLNALQEAMQPEGTPAFKGGLKALRRLGAKLGLPLVVKETGCGFSEKTLKKIAELPIAALDVSGLGGTHWGRIEGARAAGVSDRLRVKAAETFKDWGVTTVDSIRSARKILPKKTEIWASGGIRSGLDAAKAIALGATRVGFAKPALEAALLGDKELDAWMESVEFELKTALFCSGFSQPAKLRGTLK